MIYSILFVILAALAYWYWTTSFVPAEVAQNNQDIDANASLDTLRKAYHAKRNRVRGAWVTGLSAAASAPLWFVGWLPAVLGFLSVAVLLTGYFIRWFTPRLNLARSVKRPDITEYYASSDSASWPDASVWRTLRAGHKEAGLVRTDAQLATLANNALRRLLIRTWRVCLFAAGLLAVGAGWVAVAN